MKKIFYFLAISLLLIGCEGNNPETQEPNQPKFPKYWSPAGHIYSNYSDYDKNYQVIVFVDDYTATKYYTTNSDVLNTDGIELLDATYEGTYPNYTITVYSSGSSTNDIVFKDTLTFECYGYTYTLVK